jgi:glycosyltransferase involved in cell wall biosynthesis
VIPYGVAIDAPASPRRPARHPVRFGYVGSISPHKGLHLAVDAMRGIDPSRASLHVWGNLAAYPDYVAELERRRGSANVVFEGRFREEEKSEVYAAMDVLVLPSIGLESFGLAPREAMLCGVPVVASTGGALDEMFEGRECGALFPVGDAEALAATLRRIVDDPAIVDRWAERMPATKSAADHAREIDRVYDQVLAGRAR